MQPDIDRMVELAVLDGEVGSGIGVDVAGSRHEGGRRAAINARRRIEVAEDHGNNIERWSEAEDRFVQDNLGKMSLAAIGRALGRTAVAIKIHYTRKGWPAPSKQPDELTNLQVAKIIGKCGKSTAEMIERGILPARDMPTAARKIRLIKKSDLERWLVDSDNWIYFKLERMQPGKWKRLVQNAQARWDDEWITTGRAAEIWGAGSSGVISRRIREGKFASAKRWANWWLLRSEVEAMKGGFLPGKGETNRARAQASYD